MVDKSSVLKMECFWESYSCFYLFFF